MALIPFASFLAGALLSLLLPAILLIVLVAWYHFLFVRGGRAASTRELGRSGAEAAAAGADTPAEEVGRSRVPETPA